MSTQPMSFGKAFGHGVWVSTTGDTKRLQQLVVRAKTPQMMKRVNGRIAKAINAKPAK